MRASIALLTGPTGMGADDSSTLVNPLRGDAGAKDIQSLA